jgi:flavodoxin
MKKTILIYYSRKGSNKYLAEQISKTLNTEIEAIRPRLNVFVFFLMNIHMGIKRMRHNVKDYERIILCGPIWMGKLIPPLRTFVKKYKDDIHELIFVTCCGSSYEKKDEKFGHGFVFKEVEEMMNGKCIFCQAFPIILVMPDDKKEDPEAFMKTHLNDGNFKGEILERFEAFIQKVS